VPSITGSGRSSPKGKEATMRQKENKLARLKKKQQKKEIQAKSTFFPLF